MKSNKKSHSLKLNFFESMSLDSSLLKGIIGGSDESIDDGDDDDLERRKTKKCLYPSGYTSCRCA